MTKEEKDKIEREIRDGCPECARKLAALEVLFEGWDKGAPPAPPAPPAVHPPDAPISEQRQKRVYKKRGPRAALGKGIPDEPRQRCEVCKIRDADQGSRPCESCGKRACSYCRTVKDPDVCIPCHLLETAEAAKLSANGKAAA